MPESLHASARSLTPQGMWFTVAQRYQRREKLADGGSGTLHRAFDLETKSELALKCFHMHRAFDETLLPTLREAQILAKTLGPGVLVPLLDIGTDEDGTPYVTMPLLVGESLSARMLRPLHERESRAIAASLTQAVTSLQKAGFTHGDLSAENVFLLSEGGVVMLDHESLGRVGTPRPMRHTEGTPELAQGLREAGDDDAALAQLLAQLPTIESAPWKRLRWIALMLLIAFGLSACFLATR